MRQLQLGSARRRLLRLVERIPLGRFGWYLVLGLLFCAALTAGFAWLAGEVLENEFQAFETAALSWVVTIHSPLNDAIMLFFTRLGGPAGIAALLLAAGCALIYRGRWLYTAGLAVAGVGAAILNTLLKAVFQRARPAIFPDPFDLTSYSFPSGHAMGSIVGFGILAYVATRLLRRWAWRVTLWLVAAISTLLVGVSRIYFGVHFPTDILGGYIAGAAWLAASILIVDAATWYAGRRRPRDS